MQSKFTYLSSCCAVEATKPPCVKVATSKKKGRKGDDKTKVEFASLGHWSCTQCGKACKVRPVNRPEPEPKKAA